MQFSPAALLGLKLLAFGIMSADHADMFLGTGEGVHALIGRIVFPIFGVVFAYNLARMEGDKAKEIGMKLLAAGVVSQCWYAYLQGAAIPLNVLLTLAVAALLYHGILRGEVLPLLLFVLAGAFVDYAWWGAFGIVAVALSFRTGEAWRVHAAILGFVGSLYLTNGNHWALLALPVIYMAAHAMPGHAPRMRNLFWIGYPAHLAILAAIKLAA